MARKCAVCGKDTGPKMWLCKKCWKIKANAWKNKSMRFIEEETIDGKGSGKVSKDKSV